MGKFEFVSFNEEEPEDDYCLGRMVFKCDGQACKTGIGILAPHNTFAVCHAKSWTEQDIDWNALYTDITENDKAHVLKMIIENVVPILSKCERCSKPIEAVGTIDSLEKELNAYEATIHANH